MEISYDTIFLYLHSSEYPSGISNDVKRAIRSKAKKFQLNDGFLYSVTKGKVRQWITDEAKQKNIISACHADKLGGHFGRDKTREKVASRELCWDEEKCLFSTENTLSTAAEEGQRYYWSNMISAIDVHIKSCTACQRVNKRLEKTPASLHPILVNSPWHRIGVDLVGPLPLTKSGNCYIITCSDYFTKWPEAAALKDKSAGTVAKFIYQLITRHGSPAIIQSDQGREFVNQINHHLFELTGVEHRISAAYHPQTNGLDERFNQTLVNVLTKMCGEKHDEWDEYIDAALFAYRTSRHDSSKYTPFELLYKRQPRLPIELTSPPNSCVEDIDVRHRAPTAEELDEYMESMLQWAESVNGKAKDNIAKAQEKQKKQFDAKHKPPAFQVGDMVWRYNARKDTRQGGKLEYNWNGPYEVTEQVSRGTYKLKNTAGKILKQAASSIHLKVCVGMKNSNDIENQRSGSEDEGEPKHKKAKISDKQDSYSVTCDHNQSPPLSSEVPVPPLPPLAPIGSHSKDQSLPIPALPPSTSFCKCRARCATQKCSCKRNGYVCGSFCHPGRSCVNTVKHQIAFNNSDRVELTIASESNSSVSESSDCWLVVGGITLTESDKTELRSGKWLNDRHIDAAQQLLQQQNPQVSGFQSTCLQYTMSYEIQGEREFVQIFHVTNNHWITVSTVGCVPGVVRVYDTLHLTLTTSVKKIIADLLHTKKKFITIEYVNVQLQKGGADCGVLAIAIATAICCGEEPESLIFDQDQAREHLQASLTNQVLLPFPAKPIKRNACILRRVQLRIYCSCRQINDGREMVKCNGCKKWFHTKCIRISEEALKKQTTPWLCQLCSDKSGTITSKQKPESDYSYERVACEVKELKPLLVGIMREEIPSVHHCTYFSGTGKERRQLKFGKKYGPIWKWDPSQVVTLLEDVFLCIAKEEGEKFNNLSYALDVLLPEAMVRVKAKIDRISVEETLKYFKH